MPSVVFGVPAYNQGPYLEQAVMSLLAQSRADLAVVIVDDGSTDATPEISARLAAADDRVAYARNESRLGLLGNWRRVYALARELYPDAPYFAWGSDHDLWEPAWVERLVAALDAHPQAVHAYGLTVRIRADGKPLHRRGPRRTLDTGGLDHRLRRFAAATVATPAGSAVYGLFRADALARAGVYRDVVAPDRLLFAELALHGRSILVPEPLWRRRFKKQVSNDRQLRAFFPDARPPAFMRLPCWLQHSCVLALRLHAGAESRPDVSAPAGLAFGILYAVLTPVRRGRMAGRRARRRLRRTARRLGRGLRKRRRRRPAFRSFC